MKRGEWSGELLLARVRALFALFPFLFSIFFLPGCASPGEPIERKPPVPTAIQDLSGEQAGNSVELTFTLPQDTVEHRPLKQPPDIDVYRNLSSTAPSGVSAPAPSAPALLVTIPSAMVSRYIEQGHVRYVDTLRAQDWSLAPNEGATYMVRTRASPKKASAESNVITLRVDPAAEPIDDLRAENARSAIKLSWTPSTKTPAGPAPPVKTYRIYRAELRPSAPVPSGSAPGSGSVRSSAPKSELKLVKLVESESPSYEDSQAEFGRSYAYAVRSVVDYSGREVESSNSNTVTITVRDIVPPSGPRGLVVVFMPAEGQTPAHLELSWSINPETDVAGYNVYRSEAQGELGTRLNQDLLPSPAFRDMSTTVGHSYFYKVTAVDDSGNESSTSAAVSGEVPAESQPKP